MGGGKLLSSKISFGRILLLFVCCIFCNNVFAQDWQTIQDFESSPAVTACKFDGSVSDVSKAAASIINNVENHGKVGEFQMKEGYQGHHGIVFSVDLGTKRLSEYTDIRFDIHYLSEECKQKHVIVAVRNGSSGGFTELANKLNENTVSTTTWQTFTFDSFSSSGKDYSDFEIFISLGDMPPILSFQIDNIQLYGPAIGSSPVEIEIDETKNNTITAKYYDTVRLYRTLTAGMWNTICLPFVPTEDQAKTIFGTTAKFAEFSSVSNDGVMQFKSVDFNELQAGTPYLVLPSQDKTAASPIVLTGVTIPATATSAGEVPIGNYTFKGIYSPEPFEKDDYTIRFVGTGNQLLYPNKSNSLKALRAYFKILPDAQTPTNPAKDYTFEVDSFVPTSIANIQIEGDGDGAIYNIGGQRVEGKSLPKGIYIRDGKKFVVK